MRKGLCILLTILFLVAVASAEDNVLGLQDNGIRLITYNNSDEYQFGIINQYGDDLGINYPYIGRFLDGYAVFADDHGRVGVLNTKGETVIQPAYDYVAYLKNGVFWATDEHGLYLLNVSGEIVAFIQNAVVKCGYDDYIIFYGDRGMGVLLSDGKRDRKSSPQTDRGEGCLYDNGRGERGQGLVPLPWQGGKMGCNVRQGDSAASAGNGRRWDLAQI